jgi:hypothetical protein
MTTAGATADEVRPFFRLEWFRKPLKDQRVVGPDGPETAVVSIVDDEWARLLVSLSHEGGKLWRSEPEVDFHGEWHISMAGR